MDELLIETAKAKQEIAKATGKSIDVVREAGEFIAKFVAGPLEQGVGIFEDNLRYFRWERQLRLMYKAEELLRSLGMSSPNRAVPLKVALPIFRAASIEENDDLQDRWAGLLVNAANIDSGIEVSISFVAILEQISPLEAQILEAVYSNSFDQSIHVGVITSDLPYAARIETEEDRKPSPKHKELPKEVKLAMENLERLNCIRLGITYGGGGSFNRINPTLLGKEFVEACRVKKT